MGEVLFIALAIVVVVIAAVLVRHTVKERQPKDYEERPPAPEAVSQCRTPEQMAVARELARQILETDARQHPR
ncbi:hypothetical protein BJ994_000139 [Arthrobacter pigmenti]|uniref:Uncharacterized protein n=1 Tax=Arthrobacter pigmenti TaxID=271432 RepID=A0A846RDI8_9MICC|nr:hypothetical protein [Arthrobacter pigmenti]NJC21063.1 hypothetical protein [Arthrobacter pigmenti]